MPASSPKTSIGRRSTPRLGGDWWRELPLIGGVVTGLTLLWMRGALFVLDGAVSGYHWPEWLHNAWHVTHGRWDRMSGFRKPLHGYLVGMLGEPLGYPDAAIVVASAAATVMVLSSALLARVLGGPVAGGLAAVTIGAVPLVANAAHWGTGYPLLAAASGAALATAVLFASRPTRGTLACMTIATAWALATEDRGMLVMPWVFGMAGIAWFRESRPRLGWWLAAALAMTVLPQASDHVLGHRAPVALSAEAKRQVQKEVVLRWLRIEPAPEMVQACARVEAADTLELDFFTTPCARAVLAYNSTVIAPKATFFSATALAGGLVLWLVGGPRRGRRMVWVGLAAGGLTWALFGAATPMPHRYILQFVVPLAVVVPVALGRIGEWLGPSPWGWLVSLLLCCGAGYHTWTVDPHERDGPWQRTRGDWSLDTWPAHAAMVRAHVPPDESVLDCADHGINSALLPDNVVGPAPFLSPDAGFCREWIANPTAFGAARRWVVVHTAKGLFDSGRKTTLRVDRLVANTDGWERSDGSDGVELWVRPQ